MKSFIQFVTEITRLDAPEADAELKRAVFGHLNKGKKISTFRGENPQRMMYRTTSAHDGMERTENIKSTEAARLNQGVRATPAAGGY
tara:strand:+ start:163 stop:423 length:261 start_codon:yes stop_codon:yes gene_type:complete